MVYFILFIIVIDKIGYLPIQRQDADFLFQLINALHERHSIIFTTNSSLLG
ncbi:ATP-binding protein [Enterococcus faecalis]|uniref:ATP-binding protein n=1 Tax=Enterococcus faecalis TaxID=1351 RepID=UPI00098D3565|nr:ATP-binding protein [Enterococcus faecalis]EGO5802474.1 ATP-binding protein [Enterococcus faecalis]NSV77054.1 ATP-binding protein [Enterococcus faecalis]QTI52478.1 ATP-binding protein [Enterococcus faecalis]TQA88744.1 hypothetical protein FKY89_12755 [Enterococcus faecalis]